jgi:hypothetical protein
VGPLTEALTHEDRHRRAKYLGALADRYSSDECARLGLDVREAMKSPLASIITRQDGPLSRRGQNDKV